MLLSLKGVLGYLKKLYGRLIFFYGLKRFGLGIMSFLVPLPVNAPKKWIKQEIHHAQELLKHHSSLRHQAGLHIPENPKDPKQYQLPRPDSKDLWGVKLSHAFDLPKKRGRPRKTDFDQNQTRIVFYRNLPT